MSCAAMAIHTQPEARSDSVGRFGAPSSLGRFCDQHSLSPVGTCSMGKRQHEGLKRILTDVGHTHSCTPRVAVGVRCSSVILVRRRSLTKTTASVILTRSVTQHTLHDAHSSHEKIR